MVELLQFRETVQFFQIIRSIARMVLRSFYPKAHSLPPRFTIFSGSSRGASIASTAVFILCPCWLNNLWFTGFYRRGAEVAEDVSYTLEQIMSFSSQVTVERVDQRL